MGARSLAWAAITSLVVNLVGGGLMPRSVTATPSPGSGAASAEPAPAWHEGLLADEAGSPRKTKARSEVDPLPARFSLAEAGRGRRSESLTPP